MQKFVTVLILPTPEPGLKGPLGLLPQKVLSVSGLSMGPFTLVFMGGEHCRKLSRDQLRDAHHSRDRGWQRRAGPGASKPWCVKLAPPQVPPTQPPGAPPQFSPGHRAEPPIGAEAEVCLFENTLLAPIRGPAGHSRCSQIFGICNGCSVLASLGSPVHG